MRECVRGCVQHDGTIYATHGARAEGEVPDAVERHRIHGAECRSRDADAGARTRLSRRPMAVDGTVYVTGGYNGTDRVATNDAYDMEADSWNTSLTDMPVTQNLPRCVQLKRLPLGFYLKFPSRCRRPFSEVRSEDRCVGRWPTGVGSWSSQTHWLYHFDADRWEFVDTMPEE